MFRKIKLFVIPIVVISILGVGGYFAYKHFSTPKAVVSNEITATARIDTIEVAIQGTGTVEPFERFDIVPLVRGKILESPYEQGDYVEKGAVLYRFDDSDLRINIQKTQNSISKQNISNQSTVDSINKLVVKAPIDGRLIDFNLKKGDTINSGAKVGTITEQSKLTLTIPFNSEQIHNIHIGDHVDVSLNDYMSFIDGTVIEKSDFPQSSEDGAVLYMVKVVVDNTGGLSGGVMASGIVNGMASSAASQFEIYDEQPVVSEVAGTVKSINVQDNEYVYEGQVLIELENDTLSQTVARNSIESNDLQLNLQSQNRQMEDYNVTSPISGTIITKNYKAGDTLDSSSTTTKALAVVANMSKMKFSTKVDELDIAKVEIGQQVEVTCDAIKGETFIGEVSSIASEGTSENGVTNYLVEVTINEPKDLKPGMNVDSKILVGNRENVLVLPIEAVNHSNDVSYVWLKPSENYMQNMGERFNRQRGPMGEATEGSGGENGAPPQAGQEGEAVRRPQGETAGEGQEGGAVRRPQGEAAGEGPQGSTLGGARPANSSSMPTIDRIRIEVVTGASNKDYIEIVSGLSEGDVVILEGAPASSMGNRQMVMPMGGGGMSMGGGGGAPRTAVRIGG